MGRELETRLLYAHEVDREWHFKRLSIESILVADWNQHIVDEWQKYGANKSGNNILFYSCMAAGYVASWTEACENGLAIHPCCVIMGGEV